MIFLVDVHLTGGAVLLRGTLDAAGWTDLLNVRLLTFAEAGLPAQSPDRAV